MDIRLYAAARPWMLEGVAANGWLLAHRTWARKVLAVGGLILFSASIKGDVPRTSSPHGWRSAVADKTKPARKSGIHGFSSERAWRDFSLRFGTSRNLATELSSIQRPIAQLARCAPCRQPWDVPLRSASAALSSPPSTRRVGPPHHSRSPRGGPSPAPARSRPQMATANPIEQWTISSLP